MKQIKDGILSVYPDATDFVDNFTGYICRIPGKGYLEVYAQGTHYRASASTINTVVKPTVFDAVSSVKFNRKDDASNDLEVNV